MKNVATLLALVLILPACAHRVPNNPSARTNFIGTWTTADVTLPDQTLISDVTTIIRPDGSYISRYTISRAGETRQQTTGGRWKIKNGFFIETQTNVNGTSAIGESGTSKILRLDNKEMILSNWYSPQRVFLRQR